MTPSELGTGMPCGTLTSLGPPGVPALLGWPPHRMYASLVICLLTYSRLHIACPVPFPAAWQIEAPGPQPFPRPLPSFPCSVRNVAVPQAALWSRTLLPISQSTTVLKGVAGMIPTPQFTFHPSTKYLPLRSDQLIAFLVLSISWPLAIP